jgi:hypothetical protein
MVAGNFILEDAMIRRRAVIRFVLVMMLGTAAGIAAQPDPAIADAKRILDLVRGGKGDALAAEFNEKMAAAITKEQVAQVWAAVEQQAGAFQKVIDEQLMTPPPAPGITVVVLSLQFDNAVANFTVAFDAQKKIAGLSIRPRQ